MSEQLIIDYCPKCRTQNAMYAGDLDDCTGPVFDGYECYNCGNTVLYEHSEWDSFGDEPYYEKGKPLISFVRNVQ